ncbi:uncharacterized protein VICG_01923 [Vittaforma corneae ATCC 50505]|uniref:Uncharacterized protein n=1 Tax=Vittaforma corneae (strain ATCC 50505) TaxID=993615 RepID=L2GJK7_VITCO|nr:uncharacterized protein VICG_01923 [Vittaforma corneae ATCC 50505]ELA41041.1 hypothetical protein VICG_01923 [Vittaforma corneae ATCC 50505]
MLMTILTFLVFASKAFCNGEDGAQPVDEQDTAQNATFCEQHQSAGCEQPADEPSRVSNFMSESMKEFQIQIEDLYTSLMEALSKILFPGGETVNGGSVAISKHINYVFLYATLICTTVSVIILASYYFSNAKEEIH